MRTPTALISTANGNIDNKKETLMLEVTNEGYIGRAIDNQIRAFASAPSKTPR